MKNKVSDDSILLHMNFTTTDFQVENKIKYCKYDMRLGGYVGNCLVIESICYYLSLMGLSIKKKIWSFEFLKYSFLHPQHPPIHNHTWSSNEITGWAS